MTETITGMSSMLKEAKKIRSSSSRAPSAEETAIAQLVRSARDRGEDITGPGGLAKSITCPLTLAARGHSLRRLATARHGRERAKGRPERRGRPYPGEDLARPAVARHALGIDDVRPRQHPGNNPGSAAFTRVRRHDAQSLTKEQVQPSPLGQTHPRHQRPALGAGRIDPRKSNPAAAQGRSHITIRYTAIGSVNKAQWSR